MVNIILVVLISILPDFSLKETMVYTNLLIAIFNLLPIFPLDGGRAIEAVLKCFVKSNVASEIVHKVSNVCLVIFTVIAIVGMVWLKNIAIGAIVGYLWVIVMVENRRYRLKARVYNILEKSKEIKSVV